MVAGTLLTSIGLSVYEHDNYKEVVDGFSCYSAICRLWTREEFIKF